MRILEMIPYGNLKAFKHKDDTLGFPGPVSDQLALDQAFLRYLSSSQPFLETLAFPLATPSFYSLDLPHLKRLFVYLNSYPGRNCIPPPDCDHNSLAASLFPRLTSLQAIVIAPAEFEEVFAQRESDDYTMYPTLPAWRAGITSLIASSR